MTPNKAGPSPPDDEPIDLIIAGGKIIDGTGAAAWSGDVGVRDARIVALGDLSGAGRRRVIDARGLAVAPGFIDAHTHDDGALIEMPLLTPKTSQGVTTVVTGNCGFSLAPLQIGDRPLPPPLDAVSPPHLVRFARFADYLEALRGAPPAVNVAPLVGHGTMRVAAMRSLDRPADAGERAAMERMADEAIEAGAIGLSSGLFYPPAQAAPAEEVALLARRFARAGKIYAAHIRDEADRVEEALEEAFWIARDAGLPLIISHHKVSGHCNHGRSRETLPMIARARARQPIGLDAYPYAASSTMLNPVSWAAASRTVVTWSEKYPAFAGRDLSDIADELGLSERDAIDALVPAGGIFFMMDEADVARILSVPETMIGSDGIPFDTFPHPRLWGSFTRVLGHYVRDQPLFSVEEAVRRMTSLPAAQFGLRDRGTIAVGAFADLVLFDPATVADAATFAAPTRPSIGIHHVFANGTEIWRDGAATGARPGRVLQRG